ncbi:MAG: SurA N-terminal domain-containing protein [Frankia sp.]|nr:SurA N-terminal domain-containing protein [Frankia sp.]
MKFPRLLIAACGLLAVVGTACSNHAGAAAQVGDTTIDTSELSARVDRGLAAAEALTEDQVAFVGLLFGNQLTWPRTIDRSALQLNTLSLMVRLELLEAEADRLGITVTDQEVDATLQAMSFQYGGIEALRLAFAANGTAPEDLPEIARADLLESRILDEVAPRLVASNDDTRKAYDNLLTAYDDMRSLCTGATGDVRDACNVLTTPIGSATPSYEAVRPYLSRLLQSDARQAELNPLLEDAARREGVSVSPRFGVWSVDDLSVVADRTSGSIATTPTPVPTMDLTQLSG